MLSRVKVRLRRLLNVQTVCIRGVKVCTSRHEVPLSIRLMLYRGAYETPECDFVEGTVRAEDRVLELGAGIGLVGLIATRICGEGNVMSCEANPNLESLIRKNYRLNGWRPNILMRAASSDGREVDFFLNSKLLSSSMIDRESTDKGIGVSSYAVNELIERHCPTVTVMDVEGGESVLIPVADLSQVRALIVEMHPHVVGAECVDGLLRNIEARGLILVERQHRTYLFSRRRMTLT